MAIISVKQYNHDSYFQAVSPLKGCKHNNIDTAITYNTRDATEQTNYLANNVTSNAGIKGNPYRYKMKNQRSEDYIVSL